MRPLLLLPLVLAGCLAPDPAFYDDHHEGAGRAVAAGIHTEVLEARAGVPPSFSVRPGAVALTVERLGADPQGGFWLDGPVSGSWSGVNRVVVEDPDEGEWSVRPWWKVADAAYFEASVEY